MNLKLKQLVSAAALALGALAAQASTVAVPPGGSLGTNPDHQSFYGLSNGATNTYSFQLLSGDAAHPNTWDLLGYFTGIFLAVDVTKISVDGSAIHLSVTPSFGDDTFTFGGLTDGNYTLTMQTGITPGATGVLYGELTAVANVSPVPEPDRSAMLLAGLGVAGILVMRRRPQ